MKTFMRYKEICPYTCIYCGRKLANQAYRLSGKWIPSEVRFYCKQNFKEGHKKSMELFFEFESGKMLQYCIRDGVTQVQAYNHDTPTTEIKDIKTFPHTLISSLDQFIKLDFSSLQTVEDKLKMLLTFS